MNNIADDGSYGFPAQKAPDQKHRIFWESLYKLLSEDEIYALDNIIKRVAFRPGQEIYRQGRFQRFLYLIEQGQAKHVFTSHGQEVFIKKLKPGDIAGVDNFFDGGCCTTTLVALEHLKVRIIPAKELQESGYYNDLEVRLKNFCAKAPLIRDLLRQNAQDRRHHKRLPMKGMILIRDVEGMSILDPATLKGQIKDFSSGGMAVEVKIEGNHQIQLMQGQNFKIRFNLPPSMTVVDRIGLILGARRQYEDTEESGSGLKYLLNIKFNEQVDPGIISEYTSYLKMLSKIGV